MNPFYARQQGFYQTLRTNAWLEKKEYPYSKPANSQTNEKNLEGELKKQNEEKITSDD